MKQNGCSKKNNDSQKFIRKKKQHKARIFFAYHRPLNLRYVAARQGKKKF